MSTRGIPNIKSDLKQKKRYPMKGAYSKQALKMPKDDEIFDSLDNEFGKQRRTKLYFGRSYKNFFY